MQILRVGARPPPASRDRLTCAYEHLDGGGPAGEGRCVASRRSADVHRSTIGHRHRLGPVEHRLVAVGGPRPLGELQVWIATPSAATLIIGWIDGTR